MENRPPKLSRRLRLNQVYIDKTSYGNGVFASVPFRAGRPVGRIFGEIKPPGYRSDYCMSFMEGALEPDPPYRFVNHSCDPNCELIEWEITDEESGKKYYELWLHTIRDITKGEQLTIDYKWDKNAAIPCLCGSPNCRGWICRPDEFADCVRERGPGSNGPDRIKNRSGFQNSDM